MYKKIKRGIAISLSFLVVLQSLGYISQVYAAVSATSSDVAFFDAARINYTQTLTDNNDGTYDLTIALGAAFSIWDESEDYQVSKNHYFTAPKSGEYLIELWGGNGGDGQDSSYGKGGTGGLGGHIYGKVYLKEGETIFYALGGKGSQTIVTDGGGGANGDGGGHGDIGSYKVGGGGGYSAVYKFGVGEFEASYLDAEGNLIAGDVKEADRVSKYIMIAAGGGGGGAGNGIFSRQRGTADGGAGGSIGFASGELSGADYDVEGTFFAGEDGKSSGTSTEYVGHGGTNLPGAISDTFTTLINGKRPNDWKGLENPEYEGGSGGSGDLRGGAGGGGFAGGSGGIMASLILPINIGGGGGGSSFVAKEVNYNLSDTERSLLKNTNTGDDGGAVHITYLNTEDISYMEALTFTGSTSDYFDIVSASSTTGDINHDGDSFTLTNASVKPSVNGNDAVTTTITLKLKPMDGFAGGNHVPLMDGSQIQCSAGEHGSVMLALDADCSYANLPLDFDVITYDKTYDNPGQLPVEFPAAELYEDSYRDVRGNLANDPRYHFIESISTYTVNDSADSVIETVSTSETAKYVVAFTVIPKANGTAKVGTAVSTQTFEKEANVVILKDGQAALNGQTINYSKQLTYDEDTDSYTLSLNVKASTAGEVPAAEMPEKPEAKYEYVAGEDNTYAYEVTQDGYYLIQAWGGDGGAGGDAGETTSGEPASGGAAGSGGYVNGYMYLKKGDIITSIVGANGTNGTAGRTDGTVSTGGAYTEVKIGEQSLLISGGGGGGGNGGLGDWRQSFASGAAGASVTETTATLETDITKYAGGNGGKATYRNLLLSIWTCTGGGEGGTAGINYLSPDVKSDISVLNTAAQEKYAEALTNVSGKANGGAVYITCLQADHSAAVESKRAELQAALTEYELSAQISRYFTVTEVAGVNTDVDNTVLTMTPAISTTDGGLTDISLTDIVPVVSTEATEGQEHATIISAVAEYQIHINFKAREGFLGGNDVPVLVYGDGSSEDGSSGIFATGMRLEQAITDSETGDVMVNGFDIEAQNPTDFANVAISYMPQPGDLTTHDQTYVIGQEGIAHSSLYTAANMPSLTGDWRSDYVTVVNPASSDVYTPSATADYEIRLGMAPSTASVKAVVIPAVEEKVIEKVATIYVEREIRYNLTNMSTSDMPNEDGIYTVPIDMEDDYTATLKPEQGYLMPDTVQVTVDGVAIHKYSFDKSTGILMIPKDAITGTVEITAAGGVQEYQLHYVYQTDPSGTVSLDHVESYVAGETLDTSFPDSFEPQQYDGYAFAWDWATDDGKALTQMPAQNWWVIGTYKPIEYTVTVNYYYENTTEKVFDSVTESLAYGSPYSYISPEKAGYLADSTVVSGTVKADKTINVFYKATANQLNVICIKTDTNEVVKEISEYYDTDTAYQVVPETVAGYTPDKTEVSGIMTADGVTVYVYYTPNQYTITFDADGGTCTETTKTVIYNNIYGYGVVDGVTKYAALPVPVKVGYEFQGWYTENGDKITEETAVSTAAEHVLIAKWKAQQFTVTVRYLYEDGTEAFPSVSEKLDFEATYRYEVPSLTGYTPDRENPVTGTVLGQTKLIVVTYVANQYMVTLETAGGNELEPWQVTYHQPYGYNGTEVVELPEPEREGFLFDGWYLGEDLVTKDTIVEAINDHKLIASWKVKLTVKFQYEDGTAVFDDEVKDMGIGDFYKVSVPEIAGYTATVDGVALNSTEISGNLEVSEEILVIYKTNEYKLTIHYVDAETNSMLAEDAVETVKYGAEYSVASPAFDGYSYEETVSGIMAAGDKEITVYYYKDTPVVAVTVEWGDLIYDYTRGRWNPNAHKYDVGTFAPSVENSNYVKVTNHTESTISMDAGFAYEPLVDPVNSVDWRTITGYFTEVNVQNSANAFTTTNISIGNTKTAWLWLEGSVPDSQSTDFVSGKCTVTIRGGN